MQIPPLLVETASKDLSMSAWTSKTKTASQGEILCQSQLKSPFSLPILTLQLQTNVKTMQG